MGFEKNSSAPLFGWRKWLAQARAESRWTSGVVKCKNSVNSAGTKRQQIDRSLLCEQTRQKPKRKRGTVGAYID